jgi:hypothetical protein
MSEEIQNNKTALAEPIICGEFWKNRNGESIRVELREFQGRVLLDVRLHYSAADGTLRPTNKGIAVSIHNLPELTAAIGKALLKARQLGLVEDGAARRQGPLETNNNFEERQP